MINSGEPYSHTTARNVKTFAVEFNTNTNKMLSVILLSIGLISANLPYINTVNAVDNQKDGKYKHQLLRIIKMLAKFKYTSINL